MHAKQLMTLLKLATYCRIAHGASLQSAWPLRSCASGASPKSSHCARLGSRLQEQLPDKNRASGLATVVLARAALSQEYQELLDEAVSLAPAADLVQEATALAGAGSARRRTE